MEAGKNYERKERRGNVNDDVKGTRKRLEENKLKKEKKGIR